MTRTDVAEALIALALACLSYLLVVGLMLL